MVTLRRRRNFELPPPKVELVRRLLGTGLTPGRVAKQAEVGRTSVLRIRDGEHCSDVKGARANRCECGALVTTETPCLACRLRSPDAPQT